jgi:DNA polymerase elongation subunit (family B)
MIASYITARGRLQLIEALEAFDMAGYEPIYSDTDSVYAHVTPRATKESFDQHIAPLLHDSRLGAMKLEMKDNVGEEEAIGVFVAPKLYALRGPTTGKEKVVARGILRWMTASDAEAEARREQEGQEQVTFEHIKGILDGVPVEITR